MDVNGISVIRRVYSDVRFDEGSSFVLADKGKGEEDG